MTVERPRRAVLPNGLVLLTVARPRLPVVAVLLMYRAGSLYEPIGRTGLAHLTEHMMFRGTPDRPQGDIDRLTGRLGGTNNAMTTCDHALYYFVLPSEHWAMPIAIEADRMAGCDFSHEAFETERRVAIEERMMLDDDPDALVFEAVDRLAFDHHPYCYPVVGLQEHLESLTLDDLKAFYGSRYRPSEAVLAVVGDVDHESVRAEVERMFLASDKDGSLPVLQREDPVPSEPRREVLSGLSPTPQVVTGFRTPGAVHEDGPALEMLAAILSSGRSSLLYRDIVDGMRMATEISASRIPQVDPGLFYVSASLNSGVSPEACEDRILELLEGLRRSGVSEDALERGRNLSRVDVVLSRETCIGTAGAIAFWESLGDWQLGPEHDRRLDEVTAADVRRVLETYFNPDTRSSAWLVP